jgi:hypothetical protein
MDFGDDLSSLSSKSSPIHRPFECYNRAEHDTDMIVNRDWSALH